MNELQQIEQFIAIHPQIKIDASSALRLFHADNEIAGAIPLNDWLNDFLLEGYL